MNCLVWVRGIFHRDVKKLNEVFCGLFDVFYTTKRQMSSLGAFLMLFDSFLGCFRRSAIKLMNLKKKI